MQRTTWLPGNALRAALITTTLAALLGGCGSHSSSSDQAQATAAAADANAASAPAASPATDATPAAVAASGTLPVYPGAKLQPMPAGVKIPPVCGHQMTMRSYDVAADGKTVAAWYKDHVPGGLVYDVSDDAEGAKDISYEIMTADGAQGVVINQLDYGPGLAASAKVIGADKTGIGLETFTPPLSQDYLALMTAGTSGDAAAKEAAKTKLAAMCPSS